MNANHRHTHTLLESVVRREGRSLLQYVSEAFPWTPPREQAALTEIKKLAEEQRAAAAALSEFLVRRRHTVAYLGAYPMAFATINFVSLEHLLPKLAESERRGIAQVEHDLAALTDEEARQPVREILERKRRHLETLEGLARAHPKTMSTLR